VALTDGYVAGLLAGSVIFAVGALVAVLTINARVSAPRPRATQPRPPKLDAKAPRAGAGTPAV